MLAGLCAAFAMQATIAAPHHVDVAREALRFDRMVGLAPLDRGGRTPEIRIWSEVSLVGIEDGLVFTPQQIRHYSNDVIKHGARNAGARMRLVSRRATRYYATEVIQLFATLAPLDGRSFYDCRVGDRVWFVHDGGSYVIEGRMDGRYFALQLSAPHDCPEPRIRNLWRAVDFANRVATLEN